MCEAENCVTIREFKQAAEGIDTSCIYTPSAPGRAYGSGTYASPQYGPAPVSY